jgi:all-trans-retinol dehydrogenase (NAD+)
VAQVAARTSHFSGRNVLVTGAASGIGRLMAQYFAADGADLILWDRESDGLESLRSELASAERRVWSFVVDLTDREAIRATAQRCLDECGPVDVLVNNAGVVSGQTLLEISDEQIDRTFAVNTLALFWTARAFLPSMLKRNSGRIVTLASAAGLVGSGRLTDYCASKFAAVGFDESLRLELARVGSAVRTTVVCPYYISTGMFAGVKTRFSWLLPIMTPEYAARRIVDAVRRGEARVIMPRFVYASFVARALPIRVFDALMAFFGISRSMDEFKGRTERPQ